MSARLMMSESSYSDIETGVSGCGTLTVTLLLEEQDDPCVFLDHLKKRFDELFEREMQPI